MSTTVRPAKVRGSLGETPYSNRAIRCDTISANEPYGGACNRELESLAQKSSSESPPTCPKRNADTDIAGALADNIRSFEVAP